MAAIAKGSHIDECKLTCRKAGDGQQKYIEITMKKCLVSSLSTGGSGGEDRLTENVSLNFAEVSFEYFTQNEKGITASGGVLKWKIAENVEG
jgi:type VI secretion system secreted protein Hcp